MEWKLRKQNDRCTKDKKKKKDIHLGERMIEKTAQKAIYEVFDNFTKSAVNEFKDAYILCWW